MELFEKGQDQAFLDWLDANPGGYVLSIEARLTPRAYNRLHLATCKSLRVRTFNGPSLTNQYVKACSSLPPELEAWMKRTTGQVPRRCGSCHP